MGFFDGLITAINNVLDYLFRPLIETIGPLWTVVIVSLLMAILTTLIHKYATDQERLKFLREETKELQKKARELRSQPEKLSTLNREMMKKSKETMMMSLKAIKASIWTIIPFFIVFTYFNATLAFLPLGIGDNFSVTLNTVEGLSGEVFVLPPPGLTLVGEDTLTVQNSAATFSFKADTTGMYIIEFLFNENTYGQEILVTEEHRYSPLSTTINDDTVSSINTNLKNLVLIPLGFWDWLGWFGTYIILSVIFSMTLRKVMNVY